MQLSGDFLAARRERARMRVVIVGSGGFAVASALSVFAPSYGAYAATLVPALTTPALPVSGPSTF